MLDPPHAISLWLEDNHFVIRFPDQQIIKIPTAEPGRLINVLRHRANMIERGVRPTIGTLGAPVQYDIERRKEGLTREEEEAKARKARKALMRRIAARQREQEGDELLEMLGLITRPAKPTPQLRKRA